MTTATQTNTCARCKVQTANEFCRRCQDILDAQWRESRPTPPLTAQPTHTPTVDTTVTTVPHAFVVGSVRENAALRARITELETALREMRAQFFLHDCEPTIDCAKCNVLDATDRALNSTTKGDE